MLFLVDQTTIWWETTCISMMLWWDSTNLMSLRSSHHQKHSSKWIIFSELIFPITPFISFDLNIKLRCDRVSFRLFLPHFIQSRNKVSQILLIRWCSINVDGLHDRKHTAEKTEDIIYYLTYKTQCLFQPLLESSHRMLEVILNYLKQKRCSVALNLLQKTFISG